MDKMIIALSLVVLGSLIHRAWGDDASWSCRSLPSNDGITSFKVKCNEDSTITFRRIRIDYLDERYTLKATRDNARIFCLQQKLDYVSFDIKSTLFGSTAVATLVDNEHKVEMTSKEKNYTEVVTCK